jgi:hypothetical protein
MKTRELINVIANAANAAILGIFCGLGVGLTVGYFVGAQIGCLFSSVTLFSIMYYKIVIKGYKND